jgi:beta-galactosidase
VAREYQKLAPYLAGTTPRPDVAIMYDYDSIWAINFQQGYPEASHANAIKRYYNALFRAGVVADIVKPGDDVSGYKLVLTPHLHVLADDVAQQLVEYVQGGGVLLADCRTGVKDETNLAHERTLPGLLSPALGIVIEEYESLGLGITDKEETTYTIKAGGDLGESYTAVHYADWIKPGDAQPLARYDEPHLRDFAAVTRNQFGKGRGWYVGTIVNSDEFYDRLIARLLNDAGVRPVVAPPAGVEAVTRSSDKSTLLFLLNHTDKEQTIAVPPRMQKPLENKKTTNTERLGPFGVTIIQLDSSGS